MDRKMAKGEELNKKGKQQRKRMAKDVPRIDDGH